MSHRWPLSQIYLMISLAQNAERVATISLTWARVLEVSLNCLFK